MSEMVVIPRFMNIAFYFKYQLWKQTKSAVRNWINLYIETQRLLNVFIQKTDEFISTDANTEYKIRCMVLNSFLYGLPVYFHSTNDPMQTKEIDTWNFIWNFDQYIYICQKFTDLVKNMTINVPSDSRYGEPYTHVNLSDAYATIDNATLSLIILNGGIFDYNHVHSFEITKEYTWRIKDGPIRYMARTCYSGNINLMDCHVKEINLSKRR